MYLIGYATEEEISRMTEELELDVEPAEKFNLVGSGDSFLLPPPGDSPSNTRAVLVWLDVSFMDVVGLLNVNGIGKLPMQRDGGPKHCTTCHQRMSWSPSGHYCYNQNCAEFHDDGTTC